MSAARPGTKIAVVDYGVNNVGSVLNMLRRLDVDVVAARSPAELRGANGLVLPGIGAFDVGVRNLKQTGLFDAVGRAVREVGVPILGICLGMQLLTNGSEEGTLGGLGLVPATTRKLVREPGSKLKIPHMGWTDTEPCDRDLFSGFDGETPRFYFVHSYHVVCDEPADVAARSTHGAVFTAAVRRKHVFGTQFHPEKSHRFGMKVLANFVRVVADA